jgi:hypothetical protein
MISLGSTWAQVEINFQVGGGGGLFLNQAHTILSLVAQPSLVPVCFFSARHFFDLFYCE